MTNEYLPALRESLNKLLESRHDALPAGFNSARFLQNSLAYLDKHNEVQRYPEDTVSLLLFQGAVLGLDFLNNECHIVIEGGCIKFQTDYKGEKKLAKKYSLRPLLDVYAKNIREGDHFREEIKDGRPSISFVPLPLNNSKIIGTFAVALFEDGGMIYETLTSQEIESIRMHYGKDPTSSTWEFSQGELYKRTGLRRLCKHIELDIDTYQSIAFESGSAFEFKEKKGPAQNSPFNVPDVEHQEVTDGTNQG